MDGYMRKVLVTGAAGFIGMHACRRLLLRGDSVVGVDNMSDYYDVSLKKARLALLQSHTGFTFHRMELADRKAVARLFERINPDCVVNLAAQAGVRYSLKNPHAYVDSNLVGFVNVLEGCRHSNVQHLVFASSSSVYGASTKSPFSIKDSVDHPISLYAATKKANELMAHSYSHLYGIPATGLRFFTVYGPWGRPDMAYFSFTKSILEGRPIDVYNYGRMKRDFTYIDDIVEGLMRVLDRPPALTEHSVPYGLYNIGNNHAVELRHFIKVLERCLERTAQLRLLPLQPGDMELTYADIDDLVRDVGFRPKTSIEVGLARFVKWYCEYYQVERRREEERDPMIASEAYVRN
jgi:UDP-glucuronate 4-epimerase